MASASPSGPWPANSALLMCDFQNAIMKGVLGDSDEVDAAAKAAVPTLEAARAAGVPVVYIAVRFRPGAPEVSEKNKMFAAYKASGGIQGLIQVRKLALAVTTPCMYSPVSLPHPRALLAQPFMTL